MGGGTTALTVSGLLSAGASWSRHEGELVFLTGTAGSEDFLMISEELGEVGS